jgi:hypothetical protein
MSFESGGMECNITETSHYCNPLSCIFFQPTSAGVTQPGVPAGAATCNRKRCGIFVRGCHAYHWTDQPEGRGQLGTTGQIDFNPAVTNGKYLISVSKLPVKPTVIVTGATGQLKSNLIDLVVGRVVGLGPVSRPLPKNGSSTTPSTG